MLIRFWKKQRILRINRNILECKFLKGGSTSHSACVLIETYWNVNTESLNSSRVSVPVLIETYWNVNCLRGLYHPSGKGINRNILECKYHQAVLTALAEARINRNILECKYSQVVRDVIGKMSINRNILECKYWKHIRS